MEQYSILVFGVARAIRQREIVDHGIRSFYQLAIYDIFHYKFGKM
jgi:hypothetical protein